MVRENGSVTIKSITSMALMAAMLTMPVVAGAQTPPPPAGGSLSAPEVAARVEHRLTRLHAEIGITPAQESLWAHYSGVVRASAQDMGALMARRRADLAIMTAPQNIQSLTDIAARHAANMQQLNGAFSALYGTLSPDQRMKADAALRQHGKHAHP